MCNKCERQELWGGLCLTHLKEKLGIVDATNKPKRRRKKVDAVEVLTTDADAPVEERNETNE